MASRRGEPLRILILTPQLPYPPQQGTALRNYNLLRYLASRHRVSLLSFANAGSVAEDLAHLRALCVEVRTLPAPERSLRARLWTLVASRLPDMAWRLSSPAFAQTLRDVLDRFPCDVLQIEGIEMARYIDVLRAMPATRRPLVVFDDHNAEYLLQRRAWLTDLRRPARWHVAAYSWVQWHRLARYERAVCCAADRVVAVSEADAAALRTLEPSLQPVVVPNGVDLEAYRPDLPPLPGLPQPALVFTGKMDFRPNVDAILWFARQVMPRIWAVDPRVQLYIVGQSPSRRLDALRREARITITGWVDDPRPYIAAATVYVVPLLVGGGTRLKVLEAMAMGRALVSTSLGVEGLGARDGEHLLLADDAEAFARQALALLGDEDRRRALGLGARAFVERGYGWAEIGPRLEAVFQ
ncbi:MAG: glycosyltransferase [Anaerolineae bacterium]